ncbi:MAG: inositol 2-dehydrogenase [Alphaproteobacteria bacterium]|nr:MAG: inositol 2-dehydrogenase [Alphaproteobacteria bacterium]
MTNINSSIPIALIGAGRIGKIHAGNASRNPALNLKYIVDGYQLARDDVTAATGAEEASLAQVFADDSIKGIIIASSTDTHADLIEQGARAGKIIFCEKPVDLDLSRVDQCLKTVEENSVPLLVGFNRRYDPHFSALHRRLKNGEIGTIEQIVITSRDPSPPPAEYIAVSGGIFRDMTIHDFDMARWLLDSKIISIQATGSCMVDPAIGEQGDIDTAIIVLKTESGAICSIINSRRAVYGYDQRIEAFGSKGLLQVANVTEDQVSAITPQGMTGPRIGNFFLERYAAAYEQEMNHFADVLKGTATPLTTGHDGRQALALAEAALRSLKTGKTIFL